VNCYIVNGNVFIVIVVLTLRCVVVSVCVCVCMCVCVCVCVMVGFYVVFFLYDNTIYIVHNMTARDVCCRLTLWRRNFLLNFNTSCI